MPKFIKSLLIFAGLFAGLFWLFSFGLNFSSRFLSIQTAIQPSAETPGAVAETRADQYHLARVEKVSTTEYVAGQYKSINRAYDVVFVGGSRAGEQREIKQDVTVSLDNVSAVSQSDIGPGERVVVAVVSGGDGEENYFLADRYRLPGLAPVLAFFFALVLSLGRKKGLGSLLGLAFSVYVISAYLVPQILAGSNPLLVSILSSLAIAVVSLYLAHGFNKRTSVALLGMVITVGLSGLFATAGVKWANLFGLGSEDALILQQLPAFSGLDFSGLLLAGIMIGVLGVLDDTATVQSATVEELKRANPELTFSELYRRGISVGREHISSLVNTLFLAYAGSQLLLFLFFYSDRNTPLWVTLNSEFIAEEMVRTLVGSVALVLAVPITTGLAAYFFSKEKIERKDSSIHIH